MADKKARGMAAKALVLAQPVNGTLGDRLRRCAARAAVSNPLINAPWKKPDAWATATAVVAGEVKVTSGGGWYVAASAGTTGATEPSHVTGQAVSDGTVLWTYLGGAEITADTAGAPTISTTGSTPSGLTNYVNVISYPNLFRVLGGYKETFSTSYLRPKTFSRKAGESVNAGVSITFDTDAPKFAIGFTSGTIAPRVIVDGRYITPSVVPLVAGTPNWIVVDFSAVSARKRRTVVVESRFTDITFAGLRVTGTDQVWPTSTEDDVTAAFVSDSLFAGSSYGPWLPGGLVHQRLGKLLGWSDCWNFSQGGTGDIATGTSSYYTFGQRIPEALTRDPDVWVFMGSTNDTAQTAAAIKAARLATLQAIRAGGSEAPIINFGVWPLNDSNVPTIEGAVRDAVSDFADPLGKTFFIPIYADPTLPWVTGAWNNSANTSSVNSSLMIAGDNIHPAEIGTTLLAERMNAAVRSQVLPLLR